LINKRIKVIKRIIILLLICLRVNAQEAIKPTDHFSIEGKVKLVIDITIKDILSLPSEHIDSCVIKNHLMQKKYTIMNIEGVPIKSILSKAIITADEPKQLSEYYFIFIASDNYKVVYSWNEIYNSGTGDHIFIIKKRDGQDLSSQKDAISVICTSDQATGRRYVKSLSKILIERVN
jgi:hypothetical protein